MSAFLRTGFNENYNGGRYLLTQCFNVDLSPLPFAIDAKLSTEHIEPGKGHEHNTSKALQVMVRPNASEPPGVCSS